MTNVIELAKQAGIPFNSRDLIGCHRCESDMDDELIRFATLVRNAALEEAAQKAFSWNTAMTDTLAKEIRELKEPTP